MNALADIYFINASALAKELKAGTVSEIRAVKHLIASIILGGVGFEVPISVEFKTTVFGLGNVISYIILFIVMGIISYYGVWLTHQVNRKGDGKDYFLRFATLTLPIGIQLAIIFLVLGLMLALLAMVLVSSIGEYGVYITTGVFYLLTIAFTTMFFLRMRRYIGVASGYEG